MSGERKARMSIDEIEAAALQLPEDDRDELLVRLNAKRTRDPSVRQAWLDEAERRMELVRAGKMRLIDAGDVLADDLDDPIASQLASVALQIPADARADLVDRLIASLTGTRGCDPVWEAEMNRRIDEIEAGTAKTLSEEEFFEKLRVRRAARQVS
jgi:putative addiction module component (TIGR02574 family)